jgi:hypothetical protein
MKTPDSPLRYVAWSALALLALVGTWGHNLSYLPLGFVDANLQFWRDTLVNPASRSITADLLVLVLPVLYWMLAEARRLAMRGAWLYVLGSLLVAISVALPVFLMHRARVLARREEPAPAERLRAGDWLGMAALCALALGYVVLSFSRPLPVAPQEFALEGQGKACLELDSKAAPPDAVDAAGRAWLQPNFPVLVSVFPALQTEPARCLKRTEQACSVRLRGNELRVESRFRFEPAATEPCDEGAALGVICPGPRLESGEYVLQHGTQRTTFQVPGSLPVCGG